MLITIITLGITVLIYLWLRMHGGKGADVSFKVPPYSTKEGKKMRIQLIAAALLVVIAGVVDALRSNNYRNERYVLLFILLVGPVIGGCAYFLGITKNKKK